MGLSKEERDKRFKRGQQSARETLAAKEIFSLRLQPKSIMRIYEIATQRGLHASDLVRGWIEKCIESEDKHSCSSEVKEAEELASEIHDAVLRVLEGYSATNKSNMLSRLAEVTQLSHPVNTELVEELQKSITELSANVVTINRDLSNWRDAAVGWPSGHPEQNDRYFLYTNMGTCFPGYFRRTVAQSVYAFGRPLAHATIIQSFNSGSFTSNPPASEKSMQD